MRACHFIVTNRFMHEMLHVSSMLSEGILFSSILGYNTQVLRMRIHTCGYHPITQKSTASTYATSTVALLNNYII